ncbi:hypothetical protein R3W88_012033 [Solanum pinnatisectum]|uniref:Uncharacterized protein n=1 Tax=Solanum pinnatisectum TaxID=50273 RepID=A0AAV9LAE3_9SOLN|nr:hypothetical protein R3W88_012033 [Solanum pinnatisectum]
MAEKPYMPLLVGPQDLSIDYYGFIAVIFGVFGKWKMISMAMMFDITGLMTNAWVLVTGQARQFDGIVSGTKLIYKNMWMLSQNICILLMILS